MQEMSPNQPYLLRAFFDWIIDNGHTPYMVVDVNYPNVQVPTQFVSDGQIVLNVSPNACVNFNMSLEWVEFQSRFSGQAMTVSFPCSAVGAIYAKENGAGTVFTVPVAPETQEQSPASLKTGKAKQANLKAAPKAVPSSSDGDANQTKKSDDKKESPNKKPGLRVVK
jgi:stringent starvation protein B